jgi:hypothetical protein
MNIMGERVGVGEGRSQIFMDRVLPVLRARFAEVGMERGCMSKNADNNGLVCKRRENYAGI